MEKNDMLWALETKKFRAGVKGHPYKKICDCSDIRKPCLFPHTKKQRAMAVGWDKKLAEKKKLQNEAKGGDKK